MNKLHSTIVMLRRASWACLLMTAAVLASCSDDNDGDKPAPDNSQPTAEELADMAAADRFEAANCVIRALAGLDKLPDNWETATFTPQEGVVVDEAAPGVRYVIADSPEAAAQYFINITPDATREQTADGYSWSLDGIGSLTFVSTASDKCYGVIKVSLKQMPSLQEIRLVPETEVPTNAKFDGTPHYGVGSIVKEKSTGYYYICVRPSGGPNRKEYSYFVTFDPRAIETYRKSMDLYEIDSKGKKTKVRASTSGEWVFAKNLIEKRFAPLAANLFNKLLHRRVFDSYTRTILKIYEEKGIDIPDEYCFFVPYGSYKSTSASGIRQAKYEQPGVLYISMPSLGLEARGCMAYDYVVIRPDAKSHLHTLTDDYDPSYHFNWSKAVSGNDRFRWDGETSGYSDPFNVLNYALGVDKTRCFHFMSVDEDQDIEDVPVLLMTQKKIKDRGSEYKNFEEVFIVPADRVDGSTTFYEKIYYDETYCEITNGKKTSYSEDDVKYLRDSPDI